MANFIGNYLQHIMDILLTDSTYDTICDLYDMGDRITVESIRKSHLVHGRGNLPRGLIPKEFYTRIIWGVYESDEDLKDFARRLYKALERDNMLPTEWKNQSNEISGFLRNFNTDIFNSYITDLLKADAKSKKSGNNSKLSTLKQSEVKLYRDDTSDSKMAPSPKHNFCRTATYQELISLGYDAKSVANTLVKNDYVNFEGISLENEGTPQQWCEYLQNNNETFQYLLNYKNGIVGNWSIAALNDECFEKAKRGELLKKDIDINKTEMIYYPGIYKGYILNFVLLPEYRTNDNYLLIVNSFLDQLEKYAENGIFFESWCANAFSTAFEALVKAIGLKYQNNHKTFGKIYYCDFIPLPDIAVYKRREKLLTYYKEIANQ